MEPQIQSGHRDTAGKKGISVVGHPWCRLYVMDALTAVSKITGNHTSCSLSLCKVPTGPMARIMSDMASGVCTLLNAILAQQNETDPCVVTVFAAKRWCKSFATRCARYSFSDKEQPGGGCGCWTSAFLYRCQ